ncbi:MAG: glycoside hydrolase family 28 protein [Cyclobacteriaceae bacterium]|nr:glycoside hydrolase family 28 protein [Cyclobacteriaceae bacterium]
MKAFRYTTFSGMHLILLGAIVLGACTKKVIDDPWNGVEDILQKIQAPVFPDKDFLITDFGAVEGGEVLSTTAIAAAIDACHDAGGGRVLVPPGKFLTGPVHLKSNVNLHISEGAELLFSQNPDDYLPLVFTRFEGVELMNYSPMVYAFEQENIAITGKGILNGQADPLHWWPWKGKWSKNALLGIHWDESMPSQSEAISAHRQLAADNVPVEDRIFGEGHYLRPNFVQPYRCRNVLISGVTIIHSPMWVIHPTLCENVTIRSVRVISHGPNNDGCNPESCKNVLIEGCFFDTGDDCIAIKSGRDHDGRRLSVPSENIIIRGCEMKDGHGGVVMGSEISGDVRNVFAEDCDMNSPRLDRALRVKSNSNRGGNIENIYLRNIRIGQVKEAAIHFDLFYDNERGDNHCNIRNVVVENMTSEKSDYAVFIKGDEDRPVENIRILNSTFNQVKHDNFLQGVEGFHMENVIINIAED